MDYFLIILLTISAMTSVCTAEQTVESVQTEVCHSNLFQPRCADGFVLYIQSARYGRARTSRCITESLGYLGCETNVLPVLDSLCSGRQFCELKVEDATFYGVTPCHKDLKAHLSVIHTCMKVLMPAHRCPPSLKPIVDVNEGYIASHVTETSGCGSTEHPWILRAETNQRFNITLIDFLYNSTAGGLSTSEQNVISDDGHGAWVCRVYATIRDPLSMHTSTVCSAHQRFKQVYLSTSNSLEIRVLRSPNQQQQPAYFLLHFEVLGCPDVLAPTDGWMKRTEKTADFGCKDDSDTVRWQLECVNNKWRGTIGNCTQVAIGHLKKPEVEEGPLSGLSLIIILFIAIAVAIIIIALGIFFLKRRLSSYRKRPIYLVPGDPTLYAAESSRHKCTSLKNGDYACQTASAIYPADYSTGRLLAMREQLHSHSAAAAESGRRMQPNTLPYRPLYDKRHGGGLQSPEHLYESPELLRAGMTGDYGLERDSTSRQYFDLDPRLAVHGSSRGSGAGGHRVYCTCAARDQPVSVLQSPNGRQQNNYSI